MYECELNCIPVTNAADVIIGIITRTDIVYAVSTYPAITLWA
jgi:CBS domain-containing protein